MTTFKIEFCGEEDEGEDEALALSCTEFVQLTYHGLRAGPSGDKIAEVDGHGNWYALPEHMRLGPFTDIIITTEGEN